MIPYMSLKMTSWNDFKRELPSGSQRATRAKSSVDSSPHFRAPSIASFGGIPGTQCFPRRRKSNSLASFQKNPTPTKDKAGQFEYLYTY